VSAHDIALAALGAIMAVLVGRLALGATWRGIGAYRLWRAGPRYLLARRHRIWRAPDSTHADPVHGPGNPTQSPTPPFQFIEEHTSGSQPCISVRDAPGHRWRVKWGGEVHSETFAVRLAWACGYFSEVTYFVKAGDIHGASDLRRARVCIEPDGTFCDARFELDDPDVRKLFEEHSWAWDDNPFIGTPELNGLKIVVMLLSNWDTKDRRDVARGSNTAIFEHRRSGWPREARYLLTDWGGSMGKWGSNIATRGRWDPDGFEQQTPQYVTGVKDGWVQFGYVGQRTADVARNISISDVRWFAPYLSRLDEAFLRQALLASGATDNEAERFTHALLARIEQLEALIATDDANSMPQHVANHKRDASQHSRE
jgi:hypothetical protein